MSQQVQEQHILFDLDGTHWWVLTQNFFEAKMAAVKKKKKVSSVNYSQQPTFVLPHINFK